MTELLAILSILMTSIFALIAFWGQPKQAPAGVTYPATPPPQAPPRSSIDIAAAEVIKRDAIKEAAEAHRVDAGDVADLVDLADENRK